MSDHQARRPAAMERGFRSRLLPLGIGLIAAALLAITVGAASTSAASRPAAGPDLAVVQTDEGPVRGTLARDHRSFDGIPYAAPPVGDLRWGSPRPAKPWTATRDATRPGNACAQTGGFPGDKP